jgi:replicative DNA helicase
MSANMGTCTEARIPPHSIDSEQAVLGGLMLDERALPRIADWLKEENFYRKDHRLIFRAISQLLSAGKPTDAVTMGEYFEDNNLTELVGGSSYVIQLANSTPSAANIVAYAEIVREKSILRSLIDIGTTLAEDAFGKGQSSTDLVATASQQLNGITSTTSRGGLLSVKTVLKTQYAEMMERYQSKALLLGIETPWLGINKLTKGLRNAALYIVGGRPNMGKSIMGGQIAVHAALRGNRVGWFSVEMTAQECMNRAIAAHGDIPFDWVEQPNDDARDSEIYWGRYTSIYEQLINSRLLIDATPGLRIEQMLARVRREQQRAPFDLIVLDHMHDMDTDTKQEYRRELGRITQGCKTVAKDFNCPFVLLAQLKRTENKAKPTLSDLRESGEIEQKADVVFFVHRPDYYDKETHLKGLVEIIPAKGRNIRVGESIFLSNNSGHMRFDDFEGSLPQAPQRAPRSRGFAHTDHRSAAAGDA